MAGKSIAVLQDDLADTRSEIEIMNGEISDLHEQVITTESALEKTAEFVRRNTEDIANLADRVNIISESMAEIEADTERLEGRLQHNSTYLNKWIVECDVFFYKLLNFELFPFWGYNLTKHIY